ncbi:hypothetical protein J7L02_00975 [Candidatus Woesearchaeota archaeon]|nr:hypothetical protein [Candidatus Woesearchaeota archaeon]
MEIQAENNLQAWKKALKLVLDKGIDYTDVEGYPCKEVQNLMITITNPERDFTKPLAVMRMFEDWLYPSLEDIEQTLLDPAPVPVVEFAYGQRMFNYEGFDQVDDYVVELLKKKPSSRRAVVMVYNPLKDSRIESELAPSFMYLMFRIFNNTVNLTAHLRSNNLLFGLPADFYQLWLLLSRISEKLGLKTGSMTIISDYAYVFKDTEEKARQIIETAR